MPKDKRKNTKPVAKKRLHEKKDRPLLPNYVPPLTRSKTAFLGLKAPFPLFLHANRSNPAIPLKRPSLNSEVLRIIERTPFEIMTRSATRQRMPLSTQCMPLSYAVDARLTKLKRNFSLDAISGSNKTQSLSWTDAGRQEMIRGRRTLRNTFTRSRSPRVRGEENSRRSPSPRIRGGDARRNWELDYAPTTCSLLTPRFNRIHLRSHSEENYYDPFSNIRYYMNKDILFVPLPTPFKPQDSLSFITNKIQNLAVNRPASHPLRKSFSEVSNERSWNHVDSYTTPRFNFRRSLSPTIPFSPKGTISMTDFTSTTITSGNFNLEYKDKVFNNPWNTYRSGDMQTTSNFVAKGSCECCHRFNQIFKG